MKRPPFSMNPDTPEGRWWSWRISTIVYFPLYWVIKKLGWLNNSEEEDKA